MILNLNKQSQEPPEMSQDEALAILARILRDLELIGATNG